MNNGELDKRIEFIIEQQAHFAADIEVMREIHAADTKLLKEQYRHLSDAVTTIVGLVGTIAESQTSLAESQRSLVESQTSLTEAQARTEERLNIFINVVERYISGNGGSDRRT